MRRKQTKPICPASLALKARRLRIRCAKLQGNLEGDRYVAQELVTRTVRDMATLKQWIRLLNEQTEINKLIAETIAIAEDVRIIAEL